MKEIVFSFLLTTAFLFGGSKLPAQEAPYGELKIDSTKLVVVWTTGEKEVFTKMINLYLYNAKKQGWFNQITLIIWGPSAKLLAGDKELQKMVRKLRKSGVIPEACSWCANQYGVVEDLKKLGVAVKEMGAS